MPARASAGMPLTILLLAMACHGVDAVDRGPGRGPAQADVLSSSTDRAALEQAASALARKADDASLARLGQLLTDSAFLARLDDVVTSDTRHVAAVIRAVGERKTPQAVALCERLAEDPVFVSMSDRKGLVLDVLASVVPMTDRTAAIFGRANDEGYFASNALLLAGNGSPAALRLFETMLADAAQPAEERIEVLHRALVPRRHEVEILRLATRILTAARERAIAIGTVESIFDYKPEWFGIESRMVEPAGWGGVPGEVRQAALALADQALQRRDLPPALRTRVTEQRKALAQGAAAPR